MHALVRAGADVIELGVPFSDPMADGPTIQRSSERALARGAGLRYVLETVAAFRRDDATTPVVLMGYLNPIEILGAPAFARDTKAGQKPRPELIGIDRMEKGKLQKIGGEHGCRSIITFSLKSGRAGHDLKQLSLDDGKFGMHRCII